MSIFRQLLAFPMYGTALWLAWVLSFESDPGRLVVLLGAALVLAFALWVVGTAQQSGHAWGRPLAWVVMIVGLIALAQIVPLVSSVGPARARVQATDIPSEKFTQARLRELRAQQRSVFVDATAAWCVTCLVNEKVALDNARVRAAFADKHIALLIADWTNRDPEVTALLQAHARSGVPLYLYYTPGAGDAVVLPQILTADAVLRTITR
jgi:thiol:disulfide interchange protein DsbD